MKKTLFFCLLVFPFLGMAQDFSTNWESFSSYFSIKALDSGNGKIYTAAENAIFSTQIGSQIQKKITTINGLSGETISAMEYSEDYGLLLIGYANGLLQIYDPSSEKTFNFIDIVDKQTITPPKKRINDFFDNGSTVYISTNFGISAFNLANKEFGDTYFIGDNGNQLRVNATTVFNNRIFAATQGGGVRFTTVTNPNIVDYSEWQQLGSGSYSQIASFQNAVYGVSSSNSLRRLVGSNFNQVYQFNQNVQDLKSSQKYLTATLKNSVIVFDKQLNVKTDFSTTQFDSNFNTALVYSGNLYIGDEHFGLVYTPLNSAVAVDFLSPNGPLRNDIFDMDLSPNELWMVFGEYDLFYDPYPLKKRGVSHFTNGHWINIPYDNLEGARSISTVTINPGQTDQVFLSSFHDGLYELVDDELQTFYDETNSDLEAIKNPAGSPDDIRIGASVFDGQGNLWFTAAFTPDGLVELPAGGGPNDFVKYDISDIVPNPKINSNGFSSIIQDNSGNFYIGSYKDGVVGFQPSTETFAKVKGGENAGNLPSDYVSSLALDNTNQLWIGTNKGLRVLFGPAAMFDNPNLSANNIVFLDDDGVAQELFSGLSISAITVDGNNNKWVGSTDGAYYVSSDGQKTIYHFTKDNSPLPSNSVRDIEIDGSSGKVYIGTDKGLVAFRGTATASNENLENVRAFPNPVRPNYQGMVTIDGLMENADVKITDIEGNLVYEKVSSGGSIQWDTRAFGKYKVASGVYLVMITSDDQTKTKVAKIMIVR